MNTIKCLLLFVVFLSACGPTLGIGSTKISPKDGMTLMYVPAGNFTMGDSALDAVYHNVKPHQVYLNSFWIDRTDITNKMYAICVNKGVCQTPTKTRSYTRSSYYGNSHYDNYPVIYVNWNMAKTYCEWAGRRLPTEAEWEKAARGTDGYTYPWGNLIDCSVANYYGKNNGTDYCMGDTTEVGVFPNGASPYGVLDMAGNVWQWVGDWYDPNYYNDSPSSNPLGPSAGQYRVIRGGAWLNVEGLVRSAEHDWLDPDVMCNGLGFRCAMSAAK